MKNNSRLVQLITTFVFLSLCLPKFLFAATADLSDMSRYALVTDTTQPTLAIVDMQTRQALPNIKLNTVADLVGISKEGAYFVYAKRGEKAFHRLDLKTQAQQKIDTEYAINDLVVHSSGKWVTYTSDDYTVIIDMQTGKARQFGTAGVVSLLYHPVANSLFVAERESGHLQRIALDSDTQHTLFNIKKPMSPMSMMPNSMALFFVADGILQRYSLLDEKRIPLAVTAANHRPYITNDSRTILALSDDRPSKLLAINAYTYQVKSSYPLGDWQFASDNLHDFIVTGWLDRVAALADEKSFYTLDFVKTDSFNQQSNDNANGAINDMLVQSDSKTLLLTRKNSKDLSIFSLKLKQFETAIPLTLENPVQIVMGETNTLCH